MLCGVVGCVVLVKRKGGGLHEKHIIEIAVWIIQ